MNINNFLLKHAFNMKDEVKDVGNGKCELYCILTPKHNLWFYFFILKTAYEMFNNQKIKINTETGEQE